MRKILFVCKHNRFRSKIAEAAFKKFNKNPRVTATSAGIFEGLPVLKIVIDTGKKFGLKIDKSTQGIKEKWFNELDLIILVANDVPSVILKNKVKKLIVWKIPDCPCADRKCVEKTAEKIIIKIKDLVKQLARERK